MYGFLLLLFPDISLLLLILLLHMCKVRSSNLISLPSVQMLASLCNCAISLPGEKLRGNIRLSLKEDSHWSALSRGPYTFGLEEGGQDQWAKVSFLSLFCVLGLLGRLGWLVDLRLDSQRGPLDIFMLLPALFKVGSIKGVTWPPVSQPLPPGPWSLGPVVESWATLRPLGALWASRS